MYKMRRDSAKISPIAAAELAKFGERKRGIVNVQDYLRRFGYFQSLTFNSGEIDNETSSALRMFQEWNKLPITGEFDERTKSKMTELRCGLPDMRYGVAFATVCAWSPVPRTLTYAFDNGTNDIIGQGEFQAVRDAFRTWSVAFPFFTFTEVALTANPNIVIDWRDANDPDRSMVGIIIAHSDFPIGCGVVTNTFPKPIHFDDSEHTWSIGAVVNAIDVESVALHEIGHILGLGHSNVAGAVMVQGIGTNSTARVLHDDDLRGIRSIYIVGQGVLAQFGANSIVGIAGFYGGDTDNHQHVIVGTTDGRVHELYWQGPNPPGQGVLTQFAAHSIVGIAGFYGGVADNHQHAIVATTDGRVHELYWQGPNPPGQGVLAQFGANSIVGIAGFYGGDTDNHQHVIVGTTDGRVHELYWQGPNPPGQGVLTQFGAGRVGGFYGGYVENHQHAIVTTTDGRVHEIYWPLP
jgi:hypothetical protein